jgi:chromosome segregation ATPase
MTNPFLSFLAIAALTSAVLGAEPSDRLKTLRAERNAIEREIRKAVPDVDKRDPELSELQKASVKATAAYQKAIDEHPNLKSVNAELKELTSKLTAAISQKDETAKDAAQKQISDVMNRRNDAASKEPDLQALAKAAQETGTAYATKRKQVLASLPETKEAAAKLEKVTAEIQEELAKQRQG